MCLCVRLWWLTVGLLACGVVGCFVTGPLFAQTVESPPTVAPASASDADASGTTASETATNESVRIAALKLEAMMQIQAQQQATLQSLEETRQRIADMLDVSLSNNLAQFNAMTKTLADQRAADVKVIRNSNRLLLAVVVALCGWMIVSILVLNLTSIRAISRLTEVFSPPASLPGMDAQALADERAAQKQMRRFPAEEGQRQLRDALMQLQSRIQSLERLAKSRQDVNPGSQSAAAAPATGNKIPGPAPAP